MKVKYATIIVEDMAESIKFYPEVLGLEIDSQYNPYPGLTITLLKGEGDAMIELIKNAENETGLFSVGMEVEDINTTVKELKSKGAKITQEPMPITVGTLAFLEDPNGAQIALIQHH
jgi:lactoylglutathione lyase